MEEISKREINASSGMPSVPPEMLCDAVVNSTALKKDALDSVHHPLRNVNRLSTITASAMRCGISMRRKRCHNLRENKTWNAEILVPTKDCGPAENVNDRVEQTSLENDGIARGTKTEKSLGSFNGRKNEFYTIMNYKKTYSQTLFNVNNSSLILCSLSFLYTTFLLFISLLHYYIALRFYDLLINSLSAYVSLECEKIFAKYCSWHAYKNIFFDLFNRLQPFLRNLSMCSKRAMVPITVLRKILITFRGTVTYRCCNITRGLGTRVDESTINLHSTAEVQTTRQHCRTDGRTTRQHCLANEQTARLHCPAVERITPQHRPLRLQSLLTTYLLLTMWQPSVANSPPRFVVEGGIEIVVNLKEGPSTPVGELSGTSLWKALLFGS